MSNQKLQGTDYADDQYSLFHESNKSYNIEETSMSLRDSQTFEVPYIPIVLQTETLTKEDIFKNKLCMSLKDYSSEEGCRKLVVYSIKKGLFFDGNMYLKKIYDDCLDSTVNAPYFKLVSKEEICTENFRAIAVKYIKKTGVANIKQKNSLDFVSPKQIVQHEHCNDDLFVLPTPKRKSFKLLSKKHRLDIMSPLFLEHLKLSKKIKTVICGSFNSETESSMMSAQSLKSASNETCVTQKNTKLLNKNLGFKKERKFCYSNDESDTPWTWNKQQSNASSALSKKTEIGKSLSEINCTSSSPSSLDMSGQVFSNINSHDAIIEKNPDKDNCQAKKLDPEISEKKFKFYNELNLTENGNTTFGNVDLVRQNASSNSIEESIEKVIQDSNSFLMNEIKMDSSNIDDISSDSTCFKKNKKSERSITMNNEVKSLNSLAKTLCNKTCVVKLKDLKYSLAISAENSVNLNTIDKQSLNFINAVKTVEKKVLEDHKFLSDVKTETLKSIQTCNEQNNKKSKLKKNLSKHFSQNKNIKQLKYKVSPKENVEYRKKSSCSVKKHANLKPKKITKDVSFSKESANIAVQKNADVNSQQKIKQLRKRCAKNKTAVGIVKCANVSRGQQNGVKESVLLNNIKKSLGNQYKVRFMQPNRKNDELIKSSKQNPSSFQKNVEQLKKNACSNVGIKSINSQQTSLNVNQENKLISMSEKDIPIETKKIEIPNLESVSKTAVANATAENIFIYAFPCCNCSHIPTNSNSESFPTAKIIQVQSNSSIVNDIHNFFLKNAK